MAIQENLLNVRERLSFICSKANRAPDWVTLVAVSKGRSVDEVKEVLATGIIDIGENKVQEALVKFNEIILRQAQDASSMDAERGRSANQRINGQRVKWHLVGHLQTNKVREAVKIFDLIQSVDSLHLAQEINRQAVRISKTQDILIEVKTSKETTKFGFEPERAIEAVKEILEFKNIRVRGLMTIAPLDATLKEARSCFRLLRELKERMNSELRTLNFELTILSMGMSDDFEVAVEEGATMVRIGRAIFNSS
jgi:pyridoxal phosphate enzyme (YggS family)